MYIIIFWQRIPHVVFPKSSGGFSNKDIIKINMLYDAIKSKKNNNDKLCGQLFAKGKKNSVKPKDSESYEEEESHSESVEESDGLPSDYVTESTENKLKRGGSKELDMPDIEIKRGHSYGRNQRPEIPTNETHSLKHYFKDPLTYLSDYETGDDNYQRSVAKKADAYSNFIKLAEFWKKNTK